jgi:flavin reductase (DIM6/NTAB) family NADH-FMN oxidoreductase RutF
MSWMTTPDPPEMKDRFKHAMRRLASTVTIITTECAGQRYGMVATAVCSLGVDPPSLVVSVAHTASLHDPLLQTRRFCVNLLRVSQAQLVSVFSGQYSGEARFQFGKWERHRSGLPVLCDAQANLLCDLDASFCYGGHTVIVGRVADVLAAETIEPLLYQNGSVASAHPLLGERSAADPGNTQVDL